MEQQKSVELKTKQDILEEALSYMIGMYGMRLDKYKIDEDDPKSEIEYSCNGYVISEDEYKTLSRAKNMINFWE